MDILAQIAKFTQRGHLGMTKCVVIGSTDTFSFSSDAAYCVHTITATKIANITDANMTNDSLLAAGTNSDTISANVDIYGHMTSVRLKAGKVICYTWHGYTT